MSNTIFNEYLDAAEGNYAVKCITIDEVFAKLIEIMHSDERKHELFESDLDDARQQIADSLMESEERKRFILCSKIKNVFPDMYKYMQEHTSCDGKMNLIFESDGKTIIAKISFADITEILNE